MTNNLHNIRKSKDILKDTETFRTPYVAFADLLNYAPDWFSTGVGFDPSAGDGRMIREVIKRGNKGPHLVGDIRDESTAWTDLNASYFIGDFLTIACPHFDFLLTNPPFSLAQRFVEHSLPSANSLVCILQSVAFQGTARRSSWLKKSGLRYVLNLPTRPKWEVDSGNRVFSNVWDFAWFIFKPGYVGLPEMDWLLAKPDNEALLQKSFEDIFG